MAFTFQQIADLFYQRIDQSGSPELNPDETDRLLNQAYVGWYQENRPSFNKAQDVTVNMTHLLRPFTFNNVSVITLGTPTTMIPDYKDLAKMRGTWNKTDCNGNPILVNGQPVPVNRNITPTPLNAVDTNLQDPFNKPTDDFPQYRQDNDGTNRTITIQSTTTPLVVSGTYFKVVQNINSDTNPAGIFEGPDNIVYRIVEIAKILYKTDIDDYASVQTTEQENSMQQ